MVLSPRIGKIPGSATALYKFVPDPGSLRFLLTLIRPNSSGFQVALCTGDSGVSTG